MSTAISHETQVSGRLAKMVEPILHAPAFKRLENISFLGILSPRYAEISKSPIYKRRSLQNVRVVADGSRADHSIGVANIAVDICARLEFSIEQQKYAAAWGLLHDLGNWPLSHTAQHAFSELLGVSAKAVRGWLITNDSRAPEKYFIADELCACGIDPIRLLSLFQRSPDRELRPVADILQSRLTPDMIDGVWRSGRAFGMHRFMPASLNEVMYLDLARDVVIDNDRFDRALAFWRAKRELYSRFFSSRTTVRLESKWSRGVALHFLDSDLTLLESLELNEQWLVQKVSESIGDVSSEVHRWKPPVRQSVKTPIPKTLVLKALHKTFIEESLEVETYNEDRRTSELCF